MSKYQILLVFILATTAVSTVAIAQDDISTPQAGGDVAQLIYPIIQQQIVVNNAYKALKAASDTYIQNPTDANYDNLLTASQNDLQAIQAYNTLVTKTQSSLEKAETVFYEETPATKVDIETGPQGESIEKRMNQPESEITEGLAQEVQESGGGSSPFAKALQDQATKLKSVQDRIAKELAQPPVQNNPDAKTQDTTLQSQLSAAIDARLAVFFCANHSEKECCKKYPQYPACTEPLNSPSKK